MNDLLRDHFLKPRNVGNAAEPSFSAQDGSFVCGASAGVSLQVDPAQNISDAKFRATGCEFLIASLSILMERVVGMSTAEAAGMGNTRDALLAELNATPNQAHCINLASDVLLRAIREYSNATRDEWTGDEALICTCFFVSEQTIESEIKKRGLTTVREVTQACNAGGGCGSCQPLIVEILEMAWS